MTAVRSWITQKITSILGFDDEMVIDYCIAQIEEPEAEELNPKRIQLNLTGFLEKNAKPFMEELWHILIDLSKNQSEMVLLL